MPTSIFFGDSLYSVGKTFINLGERLSLHRKWKKEPRQFVSGQGLSSNQKNYIFLMQVETG